MIEPSQLTRIDPPSGVVAELAGVLLARIERLTDVLVKEILKSEQPYRRDLVPRTDLWRSCHDNLSRVIEGLQTSELDDGYFDAPRATGRRRAEQGLPLESLLRAYRLGGRVIWEALVEEARNRNSAEVDSLLDGATDVWGLIDTFSSVVADAYRRRERELLRRSEQRSQVLFDALIEGRGVGPTLIAEASALLDLPEEGAICVVCAEIKVDGADVLPGAQRELTATGFRSAWRVRSDREVALVALGNAGPQAIAVLLEGLARGRVGISSVVERLSDVGAAYRLADYALRTLPPETADVAVLDHRLPNALLVGQGELAERLVRVVLGPLLDLEPQSRDLLLDTLAVYFDCGGSLPSAAERLFCHRNTVMNRLRRIGALTGRSLSDPAQIVELFLAMHAFRVGIVPGSSGRKT